MFAANEKLLQRLTKAASKETVKSKSTINDVSTYAGAIDQTAATDNNIINISKGESSSMAMMVKDHSASNIG